jgi:hypothetical protein
MVTLDFLALCAYFVAPGLFVWQMAAQQIKPYLPQALPAAVRTLFWCMVGVGGMYNAPSIPPTRFLINKTQPPPIDSDDHRLHPPSRPTGAPAALPPHRPTRLPRPPPRGGAGGAGGAFLCGVVYR